MYARPVKERGTVNRSPTDGLYFSELLMADVSFRLNLERPSPWILLWRSLAPLLLKQSPWPLDAINIIFFARGGTGLRQTVLHSAGPGVCRVVGFKALPNAIKIYRRHVSTI
jgi:hypothetical protein